MLGGGGGGGGKTPNNFFWPVGLKFGLKIRGAVSPGPSPGSATEFLGCTDFQNYL